jgi:error-prone DNA polymerase
MGVFQIESRAQMASLHRTRPETLDDITIQVAIVRPGPIVGGAVNPYISRRQALRANPDFQVPYEHPSLEEPLRETLGTIIFQDQVIEVARAFAGFSHSEAEGLRRAMSRKRSEAAIRAYTERFVEGAMATHPDVDEAMAHRVYEMIVGFSGFGFPKGHGAAFGLLAYQSAWLRVHYGPEFVCSLLDEQPMGFYPSDALVHEAQRRGIDVLGVDVNASAAGCTVTPEGAVRIGLGYVLGARAAEVAQIVASREEHGPYSSVEDLASRSGAGRPTLERLAWSGACDGLVDGDRRVALWQLGVSAPGYGMAEGTQLSLPLDLPGAPALEPLTGWPAMVADYASTGLTTGTHPMGLLRAELEARGAAHSARLKEMRHGERVRIGGVVVARQRPGTAKGVVFMLLEDEHGTINLVVPPEIYERDRLIVRSEPLVIAEGGLERHPAAGGAINVLVRRIRPLDAPDRPLAQIAELAGHISLQDFSAVDAGELERLEQVAAGGVDASGFRAVAPPVQSFASGRRR